MKQNIKDILLAIIAVAIGLAFLGLLYGVFVYNHSQDVGRDKYLIEHCQQVSTETPSLETNSKVFSCGGAKK